MRQPPGSKIVPGERASHHGPEDRRTTRSVPISNEDGTGVIEQQNVGRDNMEGGGEWPQPAREPTSPAPGGADDT